MHRIEGAAGLGVDADVGAEAYVHEHEADGRPDAEPDAERYRFNYLFTDVEYREDDEHYTFDEDDDQCRLEGLQVGHSCHCDDIRDDHGEEAVEAHAGSHSERLVCKECHAERTDGRGYAGCKEHAVPEFLAFRAEAGQQVGVQGDDVRHRHERSQTGDYLSPG